MEIFTTERLRVRTWQDDEFVTLQKLLADPVTMSHWPAPLDETAALGWFERTFEGMRNHGFSRWCCARLADGQVVGDIGIVHTQLDGQWINDLGYIIHHDFWRQGYAYEAAMGAVSWAKAHDLERLVANMATDNLPSIAVAKKIGMSLKREFINPKNRNKKTCWYELSLADEG